LAIHYCNKTSEIINFKTGKVYLEVSVNHQLAPFLLGLWWMQHGMVEQNCGWEAEERKRLGPNVPFKDTSPVAYFLHLAPLLKGSTTS
jgi:hypothetical protein